MVAVQPEIEVEVGAEVRTDIVAGRVQVHAGQLVRKGHVVPRAGERRVRKIPEDRDRAGAAEYPGPERRELGANPDRHVAVEPCAPDRRGMGECDQPLLAKCRPGVPANRHGRCRIVEAGVRGIDVDDDELRGTRNHESGGKGEYGAARSQACGSRFEMMLVCMVVFPLPRLVDDQAEELDTLFEGEDAPCLPRTVTAGPREENCRRSLRRGPHQPHRSRVKSAPAIRPDAAREPTGSRPPRRLLPASAAAPRRTACRPRRPGFPCNVWLSPPDAGEGLVVGVQRRGAGQREDDDRHDKRRHPAVSPLACPCRGPVASDSEPTEVFSSFPLDPSLVR